MSNVSDFLPSSASGEFSTPQNVISFTADAQFLVPPGVTKMWATLVGGGAMCGNPSDADDDGSVVNTFYDVTGQYSCVHLRNGDVRTYPKGGGVPAVTSVSVSMDTPTSGTSGGDLHTPNMYLGSYGEKIFPNGQLRTTGTLSEEPFCHFDMETLTVVRGPISSRGTGHYNGISSVQGKRWDKDEVTGRYFYWGADRWLSYTDDISNSGTLTTVDIDSAVIATNASKMAFIDINNNAGIAFNATPFSNDASRITDALRYTNDGGDTWAEANFSACSAITVTSQFIAYDHSEDYSVWYLYQHAENNSGIDRILKSTDNGATWADFASAPVATHSGHPSNGVHFHGRFLACNSDGSRVAMIGHYEAEGGGSSGDQMRVFDGAGSLIKGVGAAEFGNLDAIMRSADGEYIVGSLTGVGYPTCHRFSDGEFIQRISTGVYFFADSTTVQRFHMTPDGNFMGGGHPSSAGNQYFVALVPGSGDGGAVSLTGSFGSLSAQGGKADASPTKTTSLQTGLAEGGSSFPIGPFNDSAQQDIRNSGLAALKFPGSVGVPGSGSAPGGHVQGDSGYLRVNGEGSAFEPSGSSPGGGGETLVRQPIVTTPGETLTIKVPMGVSYCLPGIVVLEFN